MAIMLKVRDWRHALHQQYHACFLHHHHFDNHIIMFIIIINIIVKYDNSESAPRDIIHETGELSAR
jgi:hypothetical protein